jgi:ankyrin repeat protein
MADQLKLNIDLELASYIGDTKSVRELLAAGADVHAGEDAALRWAKNYGNTETVKVLEAAMKSPARPVAAATPEAPAP